jgi:hypothetical protein
VFHDARSCCCFPSYETNAAKAGCAGSTVAEAIKAPEFAGVLTWQNRIVRIRERCRDLFGREGWRGRVIRTSNAYVFCDPKAAELAKRRLGRKAPQLTKEADMVEKGKPDWKLEGAEGTCHQRRGVPGTVKTGGDSQRLWPDRLPIGPVCCAVSTDGTFPTGTWATTPGIWVNRVLATGSSPSPAYATPPARPIAATAAMIMVLMVFLL